MSEKYTFSMDHTFSSGAMDEDLSDIRQQRESPAEQEVEIKKTRTSSTSNDQSKFHEGRPQSR